MTVLKAYRYFHIEFYIYDDFLICKGKGTSLFTGSEHVATVWSKSLLSSLMLDRISPNQLSAFLFLTISSRFRYVNMLIC